MCGRLRRPSQATSPRAQASLGAWADCETILQPPAVCCAVGVGTSVALSSGDWVVVGMAVGSGGSVGGGGALVPGFGLWPSPSQSRSSSA